MKKIIASPASHEILALITGLGYAHADSWYACSERDLKMDIITPQTRSTAAARPALLWLCGGAYSVMDRSIWMPELMRLALRGYVVAAADYRTSNEAAFPQPLEDVKAAIRFLRREAKKLSIDPERIAVMGESAGGTLACLAAYTPGEYENDQNPGLSSAVQAVVDFYGPSDLTDPMAVVADDLPAWTVPAFVGSDSAERAREASPLYRAAAGAPPTLILHGSDDGLVPPSQSESLYERLTELGVPAELLILEGSGHGDGSFYSDDTFALVADFLDRRLKAD